MTEQLTGVDLNGLCDISVNKVESGVLRGGDVPSVVIVQPRQEGGSLRVIAGVEAAMAVEGRGWHWPDSAQVTDPNLCLRVPLQTVLDALVENHPIEAAGETLLPTDLLAAAIDALTRPQEPAATTAEARPVVIAVPDDDRFLEEVRQRLINAAVKGGVTPTLLWRPVAALLGLEPQFDAHIVAHLDGCTVGVLSCLEDGVHAARLQVELEKDSDGQSYVVPVRRGAGIVIPYHRPIGDLATELARRYAPSDNPQAGWQLLWGNGLALSWLLRLKTEDTVVQTSHGWRLISGARPEDVPQVEFDDSKLDELDGFLDGIDYRVFEGPALEATAYGKYLVFFLQERVAQTVRSLTFSSQNAHLAAHGCAVYQRRRNQGRIPYYDHLPQLRLAVRRGTDPDFVELIDPEARAKGGVPYDEICDLGLSVQPGTTVLNFFLLREGNRKPRHVKVELPERVTTSVPISLRIRQQPAQGTARLTLVSAEEGVSFRPVELHWERMVEEDLSDAQILDQLREKPADVPPIQPQPCHAKLWTAHHSGADGSLVDLVPLLNAQLQSLPLSSNELLRVLKSHSDLLTRRTSPALLTQRREPDWTLYRAVSSDGELPEPDDNLTPDLLKKFDRCLEGINELIKSELLIEENLRTAFVRFGGWCFRRCPDGIRRHLLDAARRGNVPNVQIYFRAMGKVFADEEDCGAFFTILERRLTGRDVQFKQYEIEGLFYMLSLRETAPFALTDGQATLFASKLLSRIEERLSTHGQLSRLINASLKAYAGLMRYRLVRASYMTPQDPALGERQRRVLENLLRRSRRENRVQITRLTESLIEWSEKRGTDTSILQWDPEDG